MVSYLGTPYYVAPEIIENNGYTQSCDIWSLGICLFRLLTGQYPYNEEHTFRLLKAIKSEEINFEIFKLSKDAEGLIKMLLRKDPAQRPNIQEVIIHPFFAKMHNQKRFSISQHSIRLMID